jgi:hypothetical protein
MDDGEDRRAGVPLVASAWRCVGHRFARATLLAVLFVALTWAMFFQLGSARGRPTFDDLHEHLLVASPDGPLVIWILSWSAHALRDQPLRLFDANMFYPHDNSLAYTESMAPLAPLWALLHGATGDPVLSLNLFLLLITVLNMCGGYVLARWLTGRTDAGILAAVLFAFNGYASAQRMHLQLQVMFLVPIGFLLLFRWLERRRHRDAILLAITWAALAVTVVYYGVIFSLMVAVVLAGYLVAKRLRPGPRFVSGLVTVVLIVGVLVAPFAVAYLGVAVSADTAINPAYGLDLIDLLTPSVGSLVHGALEGIGAPRSEEHRHFPGILAVALGAVGLWTVALGARHSGRGGEPWPPMGERRLSTLLLAAAGTVCLVLAFGAAAYGVPLPYSLLHAYLPGFDRVRVPSRIAFGTIVAGTALAAIGYARLTAPLWRPEDDRRSGGRWAAVLVASAVIALVALENASQTRLFPRPIGPGDEAVNRALAAAPPGAVLELPIATGVGPEPARMEAERFLLSTIDWQPRVNGYSGGYPPDYFLRAADLARFPAPRALRLLCELDVRYVVLRVADPASQPRLTSRQAARIVSRLPRHARWERHDDDILIDLAGWLERRAGRCPVPAATAR